LKIVEKPRFFTGVFWLQRQKNWICRGIRILLDKGRFFVSGEEMKRYGYEKIFPFLAHH